MDTDNRYDGENLAEQYDRDDTPGIEADELPEGWVPFHPEDGEADGREAYLFANGHQVLIGMDADRDWFVLAYPEHGMTDLMGFIRPLAESSGDAHIPAVNSLVFARMLAMGYMIAVLHYEYDSVEGIKPFRDDGLE